MTSLVRRWPRRVALLAAVLVLAACQTTPPPPLLSPVQLTGSYGYAEAAIGGDTYRVTYVGPSRRSLSSPASRQAIGAAGRTQAYDLALWRAAQIALAHGFTGFRAANVRSNVNSYSDDYGEPFGPPWYGPGFPFHRWHEPWPAWGPYWGQSPYAVAQAEVTLDATLLHAPAAGDYDARAVIDQLRGTYPGAEGVGQQAAGG